VFGEAELIVKVKEPQAVEVARLESRHTLFTVPAPGAGSRADAGPARLRGDGDRLRDRSRTPAGACRCWRR
jgi:hypothetical protein